MFKNVSLAFADVEHDCLCLTGCPCWINGDDSKYVMSVQRDHKPTEECAADVFQSFPLDNCVYHSNNSWEDDQYISYECIHGHHRVTQEVFQTDTDCHERTHIQR